ncbi:MAG: site-2 protease family protein [Candidatus Bathyarchaeota archaeon]|nr:site-2 protease family protein [Candidatus Bathyarchaeota archaeon]
MSRESLFIFLILIAWLAIYLLGRVLPLRRYGLDIKPLFIKYESKWFKDLLRKYSERQKVLWKAFSTISVPLGLGLMLFITVFLSRNIVEAFLYRRREATVVPIIPGLTLDLLWLPYFLVAVLTAVFVHEAAHGIIALIEGVNIKSAGLLALAIFPGGFVEVEEEEINRLPPLSRMKIFSAGSSSNLIFGLITLLLISTLFSSTSSGIVVINVLENAPLQKAGIGRWDVIYALNNTRIRSQHDLLAFMSNVKPGDRLVVSTNRGDFLIVSARSPEDERKAIIGILSPYLPYYPSLIGFGYFWDIQVYLTLQWLFIVLVSVAIFNMLPIPMLDGDKFLQCLFEGAAKTGSKVLKRFFNALSLFLLIANIMLGLRV